MTPPGPATPAPRIRKAILKAFDAATWTATVQIMGSLSTYLESVPVAEDLDETLLVAGSTVAVVFLDDSNPTDAAVAFVYGAVPPLVSRASAHPSARSANWPDATWTKVSLQVEKYDSLGEFDSATNYRFTAGAAGYYQAHGQIYFENVNAGDDLFMVLRKNGATAAGARMLASSAYEYTLNTSDVFYLAAGDYLELWAYWDYAAEADHYVYDNNTGTYTFLTVHRLS